MKTHINNLLCLILGILIISSCSCGSGNSGGFSPVGTYFVPEYNRTIVVKPDGYATYTRPGITPAIDNERTYWDYLGGHDIRVKNPGGGYDYLDFDAKMWSSSGEGYRKGGEAPFIKR